jgi:hypothetical protein
MNNIFLDLWNKFKSWFQTRTAEWFLAVGLLILFLVLRFVRSYLISHFGNGENRILDQFYNSLYDHVFYSFITLLVIFFLWVVIERKNSVLLGLGFLIIGLLTLYQASAISIVTIYGYDSAGRNLLVEPRYKYLLIPGQPLTRRYGAQNRLSSDFAQVYFPSQSGRSLESAYDPNTTRDPWHRVSRYPPFFHLFCSLTICKLGFGYSSFAHLMLQIVLFLVSFIYVFGLLHIKEYLYPNLLLVVFCLFLTPVGLAWFERGQFSLYVGLGYLWLLLGLLKKKLGIHGSFSHILLRQMDKFSICVYRSGNLSAELNITSRT